MLYSGVPRQRRKVRHSNIIYCRRCGGPLASVDAVFIQVDSPGWHHTRNAVHPECKDRPHPSAKPIPVRSNRQPAIRQDDTDSAELPAAAIAITAATFAATGTTSATVAQVTADPTVNVTGTGYTAACFGRVRHNSVQPAERTTTFNSATSLSFELELADYQVAGTIRAGVVKYPSSASGYHATPTTIELTVT